MSALTVKPSKRYLVIAAFFPLVVVFAYWGFSQAEPSGDPVALQIAIVMYCLLWAFLCPSTFEKEKGEPKGSPK